MDWVYRVFTALIDDFAWGQAAIEHIRRNAKIYEYVESFFIAGAVAMLIRTFLFQPYKIPSGSMIPTLEIGDRIFAFRLPYWFGRSPKRGDIVVFRTPDSIHDPDKPIYIKRVVGLPGDEVEIRNGRLYVNGELATAPEAFNNIEYFHYTPGMDKPFFRMHVPEGEVLVFGDNSRNSYDGRAWGGVPLKNVKGKAVLRYWPWAPWRVGILH